MSEERIALQKIAWKEICPWLMILRCVRLAISLPVLFLATVAMLILPLGDALSRLVVEEDPTPAVVVDPVAIAGARPVFAAGTHDLVPYPWGHLGENVAQVYLSFARPLLRLLDRRLSASDFWLQLFLALWKIAVWAVFGGAITRIAVVYFGRDRRISSVESIRHAARNFGWYFSAPLFPLLGVVLLLVPLAILGAIMRLDLGALLAAIVWPLALLAGLGMAVLVTGLLSGWPLMWPTISAEEGSDSFEAFSRSFSYAFQRPFRYLFYVVVALFFGGIGGLFVFNFGEAIVWLTAWGTSFGAGNERLDEILIDASSGGRLVVASSSMIDWWNWLVRKIASAFSYGYFFCAVSAIYLLLRRDVDETDFDEVFVPEDVPRNDLSPVQLDTEGHSVGSENR